MNGLNQALSAGELETFLVLDEDMISSGVDQQNLKGVDIDLLGTHSNATSKGARVVLPSFTVFENGKVPLSTDHLLFKPSNKRYLDLLACLRSWISYPKF